MHTVLLSPSNILKNYFKPLWNRCVTVFLFSLTYFLAGIPRQYSSLTLMSCCLEEHGEICFSRKKLEGKQHLLEWENACTVCLETVYRWASGDVAGPAFWCRDTEVCWRGGGLFAFFVFLVATDANSQTAFCSHCHPQTSLKFLSTIYLQGQFRAVKLTQVRYNYCSDMKCNYIYSSRIKTKTSKSQN